MRLDGNTGRYRDWHVWHAELCREIKTATWVDDQTHQWCDSFNPQYPVVRQEKRILIRFDAKLVIINPVDDAENLVLADAHEVRA